MKCLLSRDTDLAAPADPHNLDRLRSALDELQAECIAVPPFRAEFLEMGLAGGGIKPGITYGATDDLGYNAVRDIVHVNDLHATMPHLLGIDHEKLVYRYRGRDFRLTDVAGRVVQPVLA